MTISAYTLQEQYQCHVHFLHGYWKQFQKQKCRSGGVSKNKNLTTHASLLFHNLKNVKIYFLCKKIKRMHFSDNILRVGISWWGRPYHAMVLVRDQVPCLQPRFLPTSTSSQSSTREYEHLHPNKSPFHLYFFTYHLYSCSRYM